MEITVGSRRTEMDERIMDKMMMKKIKIGSIEFKAVDFLFIGCLFFFAFMIRWKLMPIESADYWGFLADCSRFVGREDSLLLESRFPTTPPPICTLCALFPT